MTPEEKSNLVSALKAKHPGEDLFETSPECDREAVVFYRRAGRKEFRQLKLDQEDATKSDIVDELFCKSLVVHPGPNELDALLAKYPFFETKLAREILYQSGGSATASKKL